MLRTIKAAVNKHRGHPAVFGYLVGNEIPTTMVRWLGVRRVTEFLELLIDTARNIDPAALYSYASYPPTEYLLPQNVDFCTFNVYLHNQTDFEHYLLRLQNLADDKPCIMGEFGMDTIRHPQEEQAEMLSWHVESVVRCGLAGTIIYAWTDEWFTGGMNITDWAFGLVTRERQPKKAFYALKDKVGRRRQRARHPPREAAELPEGQRDRLFLQRRADAGSLPRFAAGNRLSRTTRSCWWTTARPTARPRSWINSATTRAWCPSGRRTWASRYARNVGAHAATGAIFAYTDGDCMADPDWLYYHGGHPAQRTLRRAWAGQTSRRPRQIGCRLACRRLPAGRATC